MYLSVALLLLLSYVQAHPCGDCQCRELQNVLSCSGWDANKLPQLNETGWILHVDIINTSITELSTLPAYPSLHSADIRLNRKLDCSIAIKMKSLFLTTTDCNEEWDVNAPKPSTIDIEGTHKDWMNLLSLSPVIFIVALMLYFKNRMTLIMKNLLKKPVHVEYRHSAEEQREDNIESLV